MTTTKEDRQVIAGAPGRKEPKPPGVGSTLMTGAVLVVLVVLAVLYVGNGDVFYGNMIILTFLYGALASSWNIIGGFAGQLSLGHAGFFGVGAYTSTILYVDYGVSPWLGLTAGMVLGGISALLIGIPTFRLGGPYYAMATLAMGLILFNLAVHARELTAGNVGLSIPFEPSFGNMTFNSRGAYAAISGAYLLLVILVGLVIRRGRLGYQLTAVRDDEDAARALGVDATRVKLLAGTLSGALAAGVGTLYAQYIAFITPESVFSVSVSIQIIVFAIVGGAGTVMGPLIGALILVPAGEVILRGFGGSLPGVHTLVYGCVVVLVVLVAPRGLLGLLAEARDGLMNRRSRSRG